MRRSRTTWIAAAAVVSALGAPAASGADTPRDKPKPKYDPSEIVCERITVLGSRLAVKRVCATRGEWAERRRGERLDLDQAQKMPCVVTGSSERC